MKLIFVWLLSAIISSMTVFAQKPPMKFGSIDKADLEMKVYDKDTSAEAVILCNYGYYNANNHSLNQMLRIKILKKGGYDWANQTFLGEVKSNIKGITYNLVNGRIVEDKLTKESIFKERIFEDNYLLKVTMPNVREGSIIDLDCWMEGVPQSWTWSFQKSIPVRWSELRIDPSAYDDEYNLVEGIGNIKVFSVTSWASKYTPAIIVKPLFGYGQLTDSSDRRWIAKDIPAIVTEPEINSIANYMMQIYFVRFHSWEEVNKYLMKKANFGNTLESNLFLNKYANEIKSKCSTKKEMLTAAFAWVKNNIRWNHESGLYTTQPSLVWTFEKKTGNVADINLMLIALLRKLDINTSPIALSTRENGLLRNDMPSTSKFNYVIALATIDSIKYLLDATEKYLPVGMLPERCLNWRGRIIDEKMGEWVDLNPALSYKTMTIATLTLDESGILSGKINKGCYNYAALDFRNMYEKFNNNEEYISDFEKNHPGLIVKNNVIKNFDSLHLPVITEYEVIIRNKADDTGDLIYLNPLLFDFLSENPFKLNERKFPVDFSYLHSESYVLSLTIPDNYSLSEIPKTINMVLKDKAVEFICRTDFSGNKINYTCRFNINKVVFLPGEYPDLKEVFNQVIKKQGEMIILRKKI